MLEEQQHGELQDEQADEVDPTSTRSTVETSRPPVKKLRISVT